MVGESTESVGAGVGGGSSSNKMPTLEEYGTNLTKLAEEVKCVKPIHLMFVNSPIAGSFISPDLWEDWIMTACCISV
jgi:hypothetical protein